MTLRCEEGSYRRDLWPIAAAILIAISGCSTSEPPVRSASPSVIDGGPTTPAPVSPEPEASSSGTPFGCLPAETQGDRLPGLVFDLTDDPSDGWSVLRLTNYGPEPLVFEVGDVGIARMASTTEAATALDADSSRDGFEVRLESGATLTFDVAIDTSTAPCDDRRTATSFSPILAVAIDGEPLPHPLVGSTWRS